MPPDIQLYQQIQELRAAAIARTITLPTLPAWVEETAMSMDYDKACEFMRKYGYPVDGMKDSCVELRLKRQPPRAEWELTLARSLQDGGANWQLNAFCHRVPNPSDVAFISSVTSMLGVPKDHPPTLNEHVPLVLRQQHFVWMWAETEAN